jgi:hypothetical protein
VSFGAVVQFRETYRAPFVGGSSSPAAAVYA